MNVVKSPVPVSVMVVVSPFPIWTPMTSVNVFGGSENVVVNVDMAEMYVVRIEKGAVEESPAFTLLLLMTVTGLFAVVEGAALMALPLLLLLADATTGATDVAAAAAVVAGGSFTTAALVTAAGCGSAAACVVCCGC
jgi:hypothetical protein